MKFDFKSYLKPRDLSGLNRTKKEKYYERYQILKIFNKYYALAIAISIVTIIVMSIAYSITPPPLRTSGEILIVKSMNTILTSDWIYITYLFYAPLLLELFYRLPRLTSIGFGLKHILKIKRNKSNTIDLTEKYFDRINLEIQQFYKIKNPSPFVKYILKELTEYLNLLYIHIYFSDEKAFRVVSKHVEMLANLFIDGLKSNKSSKSMMDTISSFKNIDYKVLPKNLRVIYDNIISQKKERPSTIELINTYNGIILIILAIVTFITQTILFLIFH